MKSLLIIMLWLSCVCSALGVVYSAYSARQATQELESLRRESSSLQVESGQYLLEKSTWAAYSRVEKIAVNELNMKVPASNKTILVFKK
ncbi:cell division protein FtsL [Teredinibacter haidensis]|uniref:cell division protein FtsL n=1 Tax=Teredinibacter haidensis TaxID=2731755 RepID=UPI000948937F|nr:cell division protein FtsL [Teredinibacter haidensis]